MWSHKVSSKTKKDNLGPNVFYWVFGLEFSKIDCHICNQRPPICFIAKFHANIRILKFGTKNVLFWCIEEQLWKSIVIFVFSALYFVLKQNLVEKQKSLNFGPKIPNIRIFVLEFENPSVILETSALQFVLFQSLVWK